VSKIKVGGQAILEGVMMRAGRSLAMAVRLADGRIVTEREAVRSLGDQFPPLRWPLLRGVVVFYESLVLGFRALDWSGRQALADGSAPEALPADAKRDRWILAGTLALGLVLGLVLFGAVPYFAAQWTSGSLAGGGGRLVFNGLNGAYKLLVFLGYLWAMSLVPDLRRVFMYHGAEHKSIFAWEQDGDLTPAGAVRHSRLHPRCSTAFLVLVLLVSVVVFALCLPRHLHVLARLGGELALLVPIAGATYELQRLAAKYHHLAWVRVLSAPGLLVQRLTTREPDAAQIEVAQAALSAALEMETSRESKVESRK
jgi:uncharacterized protein YqhQ